MRKMRETEEVGMVCDLPTFTAPPSTPNAPFTLSFSPLPDIFEFVLCQDRVFKLTFPVVRLFKRIIIR